jgi:dihydroneopterin aldolase
MTKDRITIEGLEFYGYHGDLPEERVLGQRYRVDVVLMIDCRPVGASDRIEDTIDYGAVAKRIDEIGRGEPFHLIEALAERMASVLLQEFSPERVRIRVSKPLPPIPLTVDSVSVEIERSRT